MSSRPIPFANGTPETPGSGQARLNAYINRVAQRLRLAATLRGVAILAAAALLLTLGIVLILNAYAFPLRSLPWARIGLGLGLLVTALLALGLPLVRLTRPDAVRRAERAFPAFSDRLMTFSERQQSPNPFLELLAADTLSVAAESAPARLAPGWLLLTLTIACLLSAGLLTWMIKARTGVLGYGASLLWTGPQPAPLYDIHVAPGDAALRRNTDELITAQVTGIDTTRAGSRVQLFAKYASSARWEPVPMQPAANATGFQFLFASLPEDVEYYVAAGPLATPHFKLRVVDMPAVKAIHVTYRYPAWTGLKPVTDTTGGDLRAIEGTVADLDIQTDKPLSDGLVIQDDGSPLKLEGGAGNSYHTSLKMLKDGAYHLAGVDAGQQVRLSEDYFIATNKAEPPTVAIAKPANDYHASPIEEVSIHVKGTAEYGLHAMALHYSVNGGPEQTVPLLKTPGLHEADGTETLSLEQFHVQPGDVVSLYATAKDGHAEAKTDISFIQADPFEREYSQSQSGGGGGGGGGQKPNDQGEISRRQKELIAATWKQQNDKEASAKTADTAGKFLSEVEAKLRQQVTSLSSRLESRDMTGGNESFTGFEKDMQQAADAMVPATAKLGQMQWKDAITSEQKALQYLLRAEATFRQIQVAFGNRSAGGGGGGGGSMGRDLASLLDLELDTQKNQYETARTGSAEEEKQKKVDEALEKLDALAKRQEELAQQEQQKPQQSFEQRWQQEMLRREAEQLRQQMEQIARNKQEEAGQQSGQGSGQNAQPGDEQNGKSGEPGDKSSEQASAEGGNKQGRSSGGQQAGSSSGGQGQPGGTGQAGSQAGHAQASASRRGGASGSPKSGAPQTGEDPRVQQALSRLREADQQMRRAGSPQAGQPGAQGAANEAARRAAEALKEATGLMGGAQQKQASGKLEAMSRRRRPHRGRGARAVRPRPQLCQDPGRAVPQLRRAETRPNASRSSTASPTIDRAYRMSSRGSNARCARPNASSHRCNLLSPASCATRSPAPTRTISATAYNAPPTGCDAASILIRTAPKRVSRNDLDKLSQRLRQAQQSMGSADRAGGQKAGDSEHPGDQVAALNALDRFRSRIESMTTRDGQGGQRQSQAGQQQGQPGQQGRPGAAGRQGQQPGQSSGQAGKGSGQPGGSGQLGRDGNIPGQRGGGAQPGERAEGSPTGDLGNRAGGGGGGDGAAWGNLNTGNNHFSSTRRNGDPEPGQQPRRYRTHLLAGHPRAIAAAPGSRRQYRCAKGDSAARPAHAAARSQALPWQPGPGRTAQHRGALAGR